MRRKQKFNLNAGATEQLRIELLSSEAVQTSAIKTRISPYWRKIWFNAVLAEPGRKFSRFEAWLFIFNDQFFTELIIGDW
jgi:hypothetical protein